MAQVDKILVAIIGRALKAITDSTRDECDSACVASALLWTVPLAKLVFAQAKRSSA